MTTLATGKAPQRAGLRRAQILDAALALFNAHGTAGVSTNRIADEAGVSPGNLYYWFPDKQAIIRALFEEWSRASAPVMPAAAEPADLLHDLLAGVAVQPDVTARFAFFPRELFSLLHADPELAVAYRRNFETRAAVQEAAVATLVEAGLLRRLATSAELHDAIMAIWVVSESAPAFLELVEPGGSDARPRSIVAALLRSMLTETGERLLESEADR